MSWRHWSWVGTCCALLAGCCGNQARLVSRDSSGGIVAIPNNTDVWPNHNRQCALELIQAQCPEGYVISKEEEVVTGQTQYVNTNTERKGDPMLAALHLVPMNTKTTETTSFEDKKEWRIYFQAAPKAALAATPTSAPVQ